jgi:hypothetical protein
VQVTGIPQRTLRLAQQQKSGIGRLVATSKIDCEFLAVNRWQVERKQRIVGHGGRGAGLIRNATRLRTICQRELAVSRRSRRKISTRVNNPG